VFVDLITAVAVGVIMASMVFMQRMVNLQLESITAMTDPPPEAPLSEAEREILTQARGQILLFHPGGPMSFGAAKEMARRLAAFDNYDALVIDLGNVPQIDFTSSRALDDMIPDAVDRGRTAFLVGARPKVSDMLLKQDSLRFVPKDYRYRDREPALRHALQIIKDKRDAA
jgi:SulP family sulfate permease